MAQSEMARSMAASEEACLAVGEPAPDFTLPDVTGKEYTLSAHAGERKATVIVVWGVWCPYCREIMVYLSRRHEALQERGIEVVAVSIRENRHKVALFAEKLQPGFPMLVDEWADLKNTYRIKDVPRVVILDRDHVALDSAITTSVEKVAAMLDSVR